MRLTGSITALATPFTADGELDLDAWHRLVAGQLDAGTQALVVAGSTGEAAALFDAEFDTLLRTAVQQVAGRVPVLAGTGMSNTVKTMEQTRRAAVLGADAALAGHPRIIGVKEARNDPERMDALLPLAGDGFSVLSGDDPTACRALLAGADGVVSVASNIVPAAFRRLCDLGRAGDADAARALDARLQPVFEFLGVESNPIPVKAILAGQGIGAGLRLPLLPLSVQHREAAARMATAVSALEQDCRAAA